MFFRPSTIVLSVLSLTFLVALPVLAAPKLGFVDVAKIMEQAPQAEAARTALEDEFKSRDEALVKEREAIVRLEEKLKRDAEIMSESQRAGLTGEIRDRTRQFKRDREAFQEDFNLRRNEALASLQEDIYRVILSVAQSNGYDLVFADAVYASEQVDMSDLVLRELRRAYRR